MKNKTAVPLPLRIVAYLYLVVGLFSLINGLQLLYSNLLFHAQNLLFAVFLIVGLLFLATFRGFIRYEKWARTFSIFTFMVLFLGIIYRYEVSRTVPSAIIALAAVVAIIYLKRYSTIQLFVNPAPILLKKVSNYFILSAIGVSMLLPFLWMLSTSLKEPGRVLSSSWFPDTKYVRVDGQRYEAAIKKPEAQVVYMAGPKKGHSEQVNANRLALVPVKNWIWPWQLKKWRYILREESGAGVPVETGERLVTVKLLSKGPRESETIKVRRSELFSRLSPHFKNYPEAYNAIKIGRLYWNSIKIAVLVTLGQVFTSSLAGYAFSRLHFPFRDKLFLAYLGTMMVPAAVTMIPLFILFRKVNLIDTHLAVILPGIFSAYGTFMLRQFFMSIPRDLEEAAKIDGCSLFGIYWRVILPLSKPALATLATFTFMGSWRAFIWPLIVLNSPEKMTLPVGLQNFMSQYGIEWNLLMAGTVMTVLPVILLFIFTQRFFVKGIQLGAVKG
jgi:multiple sugar transport system permease protein